MITGGVGGSPHLLSIQEEAGLLKFCFICRDNFAIIGKIKEADA
jgi:hypothetical protein